MKKTTAQSVKISKIMAVFAVFLISFLLFPLFTTTNIKSLYADTYGGYTYTVTDGKATITAIASPAINSEGAVEIPKILGGVPVIIIGGGSNNLNTSIKSVTFAKPSNVTSIAVSAFEGCINLDSVIFELSSSLATIGSSAFQNCSSLTSITIPNTVTSIAGSAFCGCTNLDSVIFESSSSLATIGSSAFENCKDLTVITIPSEVTIISSYAFSGCIALATVTFKGTTAPTFGSGSFLNLKSGAIAYVPAGSIGTGKYDHNAYPFIINSPLTLTESAADSTGSGTSRPLTPDEWVNLNLDMGQLVNHHGATSTGFLGMLYDNSMLRIPDTSGLNYWNEKLTLQIFGANFVTEHFLFSDEIGAKVAAMSSVEYVNFLYSTLFARVPDADGYNNWLSYLNGGFSKEETLRAFLNNEEWINICTLFNVTP